MEAEGKYDSLISIGLSSTGEGSSSCKPIRLSSSIEMAAIMRLGVVLRAS